MRKDAVPQKCSYMRNVYQWLPLWLDTASDRRWSTAWAWLGCFLKLVYLGPARQFLKTIYLGPARTIQELNSAVEQARRAAMMIETEASAKLHEVGQRPAASG